MKVSEKLPQAKEAIRFISTHYDADKDQVKDALEELTGFIKAEQKGFAEGKANHLARLEEERERKSAIKLDVQNKDGV